MDLNNTDINHPRLWKAALGWLLLLGPTFFILYGFTNEYTATRSDVGEFVFSWEQYIPFWDWTIYPYMSIDILYAISLFICTSKTELNRHALRLLSATLISVICFLLFPLQFTFDRPYTDGYSGMLFDLLTSFDKPYNQAPSLHISLLCCIWYTFNRHMKHSFIRLLMHSWMFLIGLSVLTTWQHHFIDVTGGLIVALLLFYFIPAEHHQWHMGARQNPRLVRYYLSGSVVLFSLAVTAGGGFWLLLWPALSLLLIAMAYSGSGVSVFQYHQQQMSVAALILLLPYLLGAHLSALLLSRNRPGCVEITNGLWLGRVPLPQDKQRGQISAQLNVTAEMFPIQTNATERYRIPMLDLETPHIRDLKLAIEQLDRLLKAQHSVLVHCALGLSRSAVVVAGWLIHNRVADSVEQAAGMIYNARPDCVLHQSHLELLEQFKSEMEHTDSYA